MAATISSTESNKVVIGKLTHVVKPARISVCRYQGVGRGGDPVWTLVYKS